MFIRQILAVSPLGEIKPPEGVDKYANAYQGGAGLFAFVNNVLKLGIGLAGIFAVFQIIGAGYMYLNADGDPKKSEMAWKRIYYALFGLAIAVVSFVLVNIFGRIVGVDLLSPDIKGP